MQVTFYRITEDSRALTKDVSSPLGTLSNITINPTEALSILKPTLIMSYDEYYIQANYCKIDTFSRYYFCNVALAPGNRAIVSCVVDPLMSFKTGLLNIPVTVVRSESAGVNYVPDAQLPVNPSGYEILAIGNRDFRNPFTYTTGKRFAIQVNANYSVT